MRRALLFLCAAACTPALPEVLADGLGPITLSNCAPGFTATAGVCDAVIPAAECGPGTMAVVGSATCVPVGHTACGAGFTADSSGWGCVEVLPPARCTGATFEVLGQTTCVGVGDCNATFPPAAATHFVDDDGPVDATHFHTIAAALQVVPDNGTVAVAPGDYVENIRLNRPVTLVGKCAAQVTLRGLPTPNDTGIEVVANATVRGLTVTGHFNGALIRSFGHLTVEQSVFDANLISGINNQGQLDVTDSVVRDGVQDSSGNWGTGLYLQDGSSATVKRVAIINNARAGIVAQDMGTTLTLEDSIVKDTRPRGDTHNNGLGVIIAGGAVATLRRCAVIANGEAGLGVEGDPNEHTRATVEGCVIRDTKPLATPIVDPLNPANMEYHGMNAEVQGSASLTMSQSTLTRSGGNALVVGIPGSSATLTDVTIFVAKPFPNGYGTAGIVGQTGATLELHRTAVVQASATGMQIYGSTAQLFDSLVSEAISAGGPKLGEGISISEDSQVTVTGSAITGNLGSGIFMGQLTAKGPGRCTVSSSVLAWGKGYADGTFGRAVDLSGGAIFELDGSVVAHNREVGIVVNGAVARITRSVIRDTKSDGAMKNGRGLNVQGGGSADVTDTLIEGNRDVAVMVGQPGTTARLTDTVVRGTLARESDGKFGLGVCSIQSARVDLLRTQVLSSAFIGVAASGSAVTLSGAVLGHNAVALQAQGGSVVMEVETLPATVGPTDVLVTKDTTFDANEVRLGSGMVPLPDGL